MTDEVAGNSAPDGHERLREDIRTLMQADKLSQADMARDSGIPYGTFTAWLSGKYKGDNDRVAREAEVWLNARKERNRIKVAVPQAPGFQLTQTAGEILETLTWVQTLGDFGLVVGGPGIGKTRVVRQYSATNPNVFVATMQPSTGGVHSMLVELAQELKLTEKSATQLAAAIVRRLRGTGGMIVIDEAQHLQSKAIDQLRSLHDIASIGVALVGNQTIISRLGDPDRAPQLAQLYSRVGIRLNRPKPRAADVETMIAAWGVTDTDEAKLLKAITAKPGALRALGKTMTLATAVAAGLGEPRGIKHIRDAWSRLGAVDLAAA